MSQSIILKCKGLHTNPNNLGSVPDGSLSEAENIYIDRPDIAQPRTGFALYAEEFGNSTNRSKQLLVYQERLLRHYGGTLSYDSPTGQGPFTDYATGVSEVETGTKIKGQELNGNFYLTSSSGILKLDKIDGEIKYAGGVKALDLEVELNTGISGFMESDNQAGYRILWGYKDENNNLILGTPSERSVVTNGGGGSAVVNLTITIPNGVTTDYFYQVYRTRLSGASGVDPGDEMALVYEANPTSGNITSKEVTVTDITPESFRGAELYTNANQQGILQSNEVPPFAKDIAVYNSSLFFANTKTKFRLNLSLLSTGDLTNSSTLTITDGNAPFTLTFNNATENATSGQILYATSGTPSQNVDETARSIVRTINRYTNNNTIYAYYLSGPDDVPGQIFLESRTLGALEFSITCDTTATGEEFSPVVPITGTTLNADNEIIGNRVYYSKFQQPEAVPLVNTFDVGSRNSVILRIVALRDTLFIFKEDGIYQVIGDANNGFQVSLFDNSTILIAPESPAVGDNQIWAFTDRGIAKISDTGVEVRSNPIENIVEPITSAGYTNFSTATFGFYYTVNNRYYLFTVTNPTDTVATKALVYNTHTDSWTTLPISKTCGLVGDDDRVYLGAADVNYIEQERKTFTYRDYADRSYLTNLGEFEENTLTINSVANLAVGDVVAQSVYITPYKFNRILAKLDEDAGVVSSNYLSTLQVDRKSQIRAKLDALANKLDADGLSFTNYYSSMSLSSTPTGMESDLNIVVGILNTDTVVNESDYPTSTSTSILETVVTSILENKVTVELNFDWDLAPITYHNKISSKIVWSPAHAGDPSIFKQFRETNLLFSSITSNVIDLSFRSDIQRGYEKVMFQSESTGAWGKLPWGEEPWGGTSEPRGFRTYIPGQKQRCRFLEPKFEHNRAYENYLLVGLSLTFTAMIERIGR